MCHPSHVDTWNGRVWRVSLGSGPSTKEPAPCAFIPQTKALCLLSPTSATHTSLSHTDLSIDPLASLCLLAHSIRSLLWIFPVLWKWPPLQSATPSPTVFSATWTRTTRRRSSMSTRSSRARRSSCSLSPVLSLPLAGTSLCLSLSLFGGHFGGLVWEGSV